MAGKEPLTRAVAVAHLRPLDQEIEEFLQEYPRLRFVIEYAKSMLSEHAVRTLMDNTRFFVTHPAEREAFAKIHIELFGDMSQTTPLEKKEK